MSAKSDEELYWQKRDAYNEIGFLGVSQEQRDKLPYQLQECATKIGDYLYKAKK